MLPESEEEPDDKTEIELAVSSMTVKQPNVTDAYDPKRGKTSSFSRWVVLLTIALIVTLGFILNEVGAASHILDDTIRDASGHYNVKVLPASLSDKDLDSLPRDSFSYLAMIDAGSSGCRAHVFRYGKLGTLSGPLYIVPKHDSRKVKPGLSSFKTNPTDAGASLEGLVAFMKEQVPEKDWATTPIWLKATAGLRMVSENQREAILGSVRDFLGDSSRSPFLFRRSYAKVIPGNEEGGFGWISFNYLKKVIGPKRLSGSKAISPYAVVEMGGASTQVTQVASNPKEVQSISDKYKFSFSIEGQSYTLYTFSYLGYGAEQAREKLNDYYVSNTKHHDNAAIADKGSSGKTINDACLNNGYKRPEVTPRTSQYEGPDGAFNVQGVGSGTGCTTSLQTIFQPVDTISDKCEDDGPYSFHCVYQPDFVKNSKNFLVFENFFYTAKALGVAPVESGDGDEKQWPLLTTPKLMRATADEVCGATWEEFGKKYPKDDTPADQNPRWCFSASYTTTFLTHGIGLAEDKVVTIQKEVDGSEVEWALGAAYKEAATFLTKTGLRPT